MRLGKKLTSCLCIALTFAFLITGNGVYAAKTSDEPWDKDYNPNHTAMMPFTPEDGYVAQQNPPNFKWGYVEEATAYEVAVATDPKMENIKYRKDNIEFNYYNFDTTFETGVTYYWAVRYKSNNKYSPWSTSRKFRIDPDAYEYPFPDIETILSRIPSGHPRLLTTERNLADFRAKKNRSTAAKAVYDRVLSKADSYITQEIEKEPEEEFYEDSIEQAEYKQRLRGIAESIINKAVGCGFAYLLSGDEKYSDYAKKCLMEAATWDINGVTSYQNQDQIARSFAFLPAMTYDWIYATLSENEKSTILNMVRARTKVMEGLLDSLKVSPYDSHGYTAYGYIGVAALATVGDIPESEDWLRKAIIGFSALTPVWGYEDGWSQGVAYWSYDPPSVDYFMPFLAAAGYADLYKTAYSENQYLYYMYNNPMGSWGGFGDESGRSKGAFSNIAAVDAHFTQNPVAKWMAEQYGYKNEEANVNNYYAYLMADDDLEAKAPLDYQLAHEFQDIGWVSMMDSISDPNRIKLMFKSSPFGSYNHSHPDQNSMLLEAYGSQLLVNSGYYDAYHSEHDSGFTRRTGAHNCVTVADSIGQKDDDFSAKGKLTGFLTQADFDLASGDATEAYKGEIGKFERHIVYIRPDIFVVVDDLKASSKNKTSQFEWWMNSRTPISLYEDGTGARIENGEAVLDAKVQYPKKIKSYYNNMFALSDMVEINPGGRYANSPVDTRVWFETENVPQTKMVVTMDVHRNSAEPKYVDTEYNDKYIKMTFENGTIMYVNLGENTDEVITKEGISFTGSLVVMNSDSVMLSDGTELKSGDDTLFMLEKPGSVVLGKDEFSISTYTDNRISLSVHNDYIDKVDKVLDYDGRELSSKIGITYENARLVKEESETSNTEKKIGKGDDAEKEPVYHLAESNDYITFTAEKDNYQLLLNGKTINTEYKETTAKVIIDGEETQVKLSGNRGRNGKIKYSGTFPGESKKFKCVSIDGGLVASGLKPGDTKVITDLQLYLDEDDAERGSASITLETIPVKQLVCNTTEDYDTVKNSLVIFKEAEDYSELAAGAAPYNTRKFLSGGAGMSDFNTPGTEMVYSITVSEEGDYDFAIKYVAWEDGGAVRTFTINEKDYVFNLEKTADWGTEPGVWRAITTDSGVHLTPGTYEVKLGVTSGLWNYDWLGFVKR